MRPTEDPDPVPARQTERAVPPPLPPRSGPGSELDLHVARDDSDDDDAADNEEAAGLLTPEKGDTTGGRAESDKESQYAMSRRKKLPFYAPFLYRDYRILYCINIAEFFSSTLSTLTLLQWLYEDTGSGMALGGLGIVTMAVNIPGITIGGVLADEMDRKLLVSRMQMAQLVVLLGVWLLEMSDILAPWHVYVAIAVLTGARQLEGSARGVLTAACVPRDVLPYAISVNTITSNLGEIVAPFVFYALTLNESLTPAFGVAALATIPQVIFPRMIEAGGKPEGGDGTAPSMKSRCTSVYEGLQYILGHPLLPGLYALDWGMTAVSYYRELFPLFVAELFIQGRFGLNARGAMSALTVCNYLGGIVGGLLTFFFAHKPHKGRQVMYATIAYGTTCLLFGASPLLYIGGFATFLCGAADAVGATMRSTVVMLTTPDHLRGRARSGHSLAANCANSFGQVYVAAMAAWIGQYSLHSSSMGCWFAPTKRFWMDGCRMRADDAAWRVPDVPSPGNEYVVN